jgi:hypothetical protein
LLLERLEGGAGAKAGSDVALGRIRGQPLDQVVAELGGEGVVGAVLEASAAAVEGGLGGWGQAGVVLLFGGVDRDHADRLVDDGGVTVGGAGKLPRLGGPGRAWEVEGDHC